MQRKVTPGLVDDLCLLETQYLKYVCPLHPGQIAWFPHYKGQSQQFYPEDCVDMVLYTQIILAEVSVKTRWNA